MARAIFVVFIVYLLLTIIGCLDEWHFTQWRSPHYAHFCTPDFRGRTDRIYSNDREPL